MQIAAMAVPAGPRVQVGVIPFIIMMSGLTATNGLFSVLPPLMPLMAHSFGPQGPFLTQMFFATASLGLMLTALASGLIARMLGVRLMMILAALVYAFAGSTPFVTNDVAILLVSRVLTGGACGLLTTGATIILAQGYSGAARSRVLGYQTAISSGAGLAVLALSGAIVTWTNWHTPFLIYGGFGLLLALLASTGLPAVTLPHMPPKRGFLHALATVWPVCAAGCLLMMPPLLVSSNAPFILVGIGVTTPLVQSAVVSTSTGFAAVSSSVFGRVQTALGVRLTFVVGILLTAVGAVLLGTGANVWMIAGGCALTGAGTGLVLPHLWMLTTTLLPEAIQGHAIGLLTTSMFAGGFLYPLLVGSLQELFGLRGAMLAIAVLLLLGAVWIGQARGTRLAGGPAANSI